MNATKKSFREATKLKNSWNSIISWNGLRLATVQWHENKEWKVVTTSNFDHITSRTDKTYITFETHTQEELWSYIINNNLNK